MPVERPQPLPVRKVGDNAWEVLIVDQNQWLSCAGESDARAIADAPVLEHDVLTGSRCDEEFAQQLERTAEAFTRYRMGFGSRFFEQSASDVREQL